MTISVAEQEFIPVECENCDYEGYIFIDDAEQPYFVVCQTCGWETSYVWCPKCGMGGEFVEEISNRPKEWYCPDCDSEYQLPDGFYEEKVMLLATEDLSVDQRELVTARRPVFRFTPAIFTSPRFIYFLFQLALLIVPWILIAKVAEYLLKVEEFVYAAVIVLGGLWFASWVGIMKITNQRFEEWQSQNHSE